MKKEKFNSISSEELEKEYKKVRKISAKVTKKNRRSGTTNDGIIASERFRR